MTKFAKLNRGFTHTPKFGVTPKGGGFTLIETFVAISIFTLSLLGIMSVLASGISDTNYAKQKMTATYLAQEGIEYIRNMRDTYVLYDSDGQSGWSRFKADLAPCDNSHGCSFTVTDSLYNLTKCTQPNDCKLGDSGFTRKIWKENGSGQNELPIFSKVEWTQGSGEKSITFSENLFDWVE